MALWAIFQKLPKDIFFSDKYYTIKKIGYFNGLGLEWFISSITYTYNNVLPANEVYEWRSFEERIVNFKLWSGGKIRGIFKVHKGCLKDRKVWKNYHDCFSIHHTDYYFDTFCIYIVYIPRGFFWDSNHSVFTCRVRYFMLESQTVFIYWTRYSTINLNIRGQGLVKGAKLCLDILTFIFDIERVLLQPGNSLLQPAKKVRI